MSHSVLTILPLYDGNLLKKWFDIRRQNTPVNEYSRVCSAHFTDGKKQGKNAIFPWTKETISRAPPKQHGDPIIVNSKFCSVEVSVHIHPENHVATCTKDLITNTTKDKDVLIKPAVVSLGCNMQSATYCDVGTNTPLKETCDSSTQTDKLIIFHSDATTMNKMMNKSLLLYNLNKLKMMMVPSDLTQWVPLTEYTDDMFWEMLYLTCHIEIIPKGSHTSCHH